MLIKDPVIKAVREARKKIEKRYNFDPHKLAQHARRLEKKYKNRLVTPEDLTRYRTA